MKYFLQLNKPHSLTILALSLLTGMMTTACNFKVSTASLANVKMCTEVKQSQGCSEDITRFDRSTPKLFVTADLNSAPEGTKVKIEWKYLGGEAGGAKNIDTVTLETKSDTNLITSSLTKSGSSWAKGKYEVILFLDTDNSKPIRKEFEVASTR